jgi:hypothetical protein
MAPADDAARQFQESFVNEGKALEADAQSPEVVKPRDGALDDPAGFTQPTAVRLASTCYLGCNAGGM